MPDHRFHYHYRTTLDDNDHGPADHDHYHPYYGAHVHNDDPSGTVHANNHGPDRPSLLPDMHYVCAIHRGSWRVGADACWDRACHYFAEADPAYD